MGLLSVIVGYLLGSISPSMIVSKLVGHTDIRKHGSGNAGATNTLRLLGVKWAVTVLLLDIVKGLAAVWVATALTHGNMTVMYLAGFAVVCGHNWPIFYGFHGGKGIATTIGVLVILLPLPALIAGVIAIVLVAATRYVSLGALTFTILTPIFVALMRHTTSALIFASAIAVMSIYRHRENIARLAKGEESRIFSHRG
jgi:acyl phosphate:glycerol-3-phosphate acyltransferase